MRKAYSRSAGMNVPEQPPVGFDFDDEELQPAVTEIGPMCDDHRKRSFAWYYGLGTTARKHYVQVQQEREQRGRSMYGEHFFKRLAESLSRPGITEALLSDCAKLVRNVSADEYAELSGHPEISPTHARILGGIPERKHRDTLKSRIISEKLTTKQLLAAIQELFGMRRQPGGGRRPMIPKNVKAALTHLTSQAAKFRSLNENWLGDNYDVASEVEQLPATKLDEKLKAQLEEALEQCEGLVETATADVDRLRTMLAEVQRRMKTQAEVNARVAAEEELEEQERVELAAKAASQPRDSRPRQSKQDRRIGRELHAI